MSHGISDELVDRCVAMVRTLGAWPEKAYSVREVSDEARAIAALLPKPVDPDTALARRLVAEEFPHASPENEFALLRMAYVAITRSRELERGA